MRRACVALAAGALAVLASARVASADGATCPQTTMEVPTLREEELGCGCYTGGKVCCPAVEENEAVSQAEPTGLLNHVFNSPTCVSTFKEMLCAQVCSPDQDKFLEVGEEITQERFDTELSEEAGGIYKSFTAPVHNFTYHVCRSFCERLYDNCKDAQFYYAETVGSQFSMAEVCTFLSTDNAAKTAGVDYHLAPLGSTNGGVVSQPKGPYQAFNMVDDSVEGHRTCWKPTPRELGGCPLPAPGTPFPAPPSPPPPPPVLPPPSSGNETAANETSTEDEGEQHHHEEGEHAEEGESEDQSTGSSSDSSHTGASMPTVAACAAAAAVAAAAN